MMKGDSSIYVDQGGVEHVAVVTGLHTDGTVDLAILKTSQRNVPRSAHPAAGMFYDPDWTENVAAEPVEAPARGVALTSVPEVGELPEESVSLDPNTVVPIDPAG